MAAIYTQNVLGVLIRDFLFPLLIIFTRDVSLIHRDPKDPSLFLTEVFDKSKRKTNLKPVESEFDQSSPGKKGIDSQVQVSYTHTNFCTNFSFTALSSDEF